MSNIAHIKTVTRDAQERQNLLMEQQYEYDKEQASQILHNYAYVKEKITWKHWVLCAPVVTTVHEFSYINELLERIEQAALNGQQSVHFKQSCEKRIRRLPNWIHHFLIADVLRNDEKFAGYTVSVCAHHYSKCIRVMW